MKAARAPRRQAVEDMRKFIPEERIARDAAEAVFYRLTSPDRVMLEAGAAELKLALPEAGNAYLRNLAGAIWRAMLETAR